MKKKLIACEIYQLTQPKRYCRDYAHTDHIKLIKSYLIDKIYPIDIARCFNRNIHEEVVLDEIMTLEEYNSSVCANCEGWGDEETFPADGVRVIVVL